MRRILADEEFVVDGDLSGPHGDEIVEERLLEPEIEEPCGAQRLDAADGQQVVVEIVQRQPAAVDLVRIDMEGAAGPPPRLVEIEIEDRIDAASRNRPMTDAPR